MSAKTRMRAFRAETSGNVAIQLALMLPVVLGAAGFAIDNAMWQSERTQLQGLSDRAALAGAVEFNRSGTLSERATNADAAAKAFVLAERPDLKPAVTVTPDTEMVNVALTSPGSIAFSGLFGIKHVDVGASGAALTDTAKGHACLVSLDPNAPQGISFGGSAKFTAKGCTVWSNSTSSNSIVAAGNAQVDVERMCAAGTARVVGNSASYTGQTPRSGCKQLKDPLGQWSLANEKTLTSGCDKNNYSNSSNGNITLQPGVYCGGMDVTSQGSVKLNPGIYIMKNGPMKITAAKNVTGSGVGIYLTGTKATLEISGQAEVTLSAPTSGAMAGMLLVSDRTQTANNLISKITGGASIDFVGTIYLPTQKLTYAGNSVTTFASPLNMIVAAQIDLTGTSQLNFLTDFTKAGMTDISAMLPIVRVSK